MADNDAIALVRQKFGMDIKLGSNIKERGARAKTILKDLAGGIYPDLKDLLSEKEDLARSAATNLMNEASVINSAVKNQAGEVENVAGVGKFGGGSSWNPLTGILSRGQDIRGKITGLTAAKIKELSGAAVSDREVQRLVGMLPQINDSEAVIAAKTQTIMNSMQIGMKMQEMAKMNNLTLDQAYEQYGAQEYQKLGEEVPAWLSGKSTPFPSPVGAPGGNNNDPLGVL
jgi:hypothetical protein